MENVMLKNILAATVLCLSAMAAHAIDINSADRTALQGIKGIGPSIAQTIVTERDANGAFADEADLAKRVRGIGAKSAKHFSDGGMTFGPKS
jgi:competence protein ComEA